MREVGCAKATVWRWQEWFAAEGVDGLLRDKSWPRGKTPLPDVVERVVEPTLGERPGEATHWSGRAMAEAADVSLRLVQRIWAAHGLRAHRVKRFELSRTPSLRRSSRTSSACTSIPRPMWSCCGWTKRAKSSARSDPARAADEEGQSRHPDLRRQTQRHDDLVRRRRRARRHRHRRPHAASPARGIHPVPRHRAGGAGRQADPRLLATTPPTEHPQVLRWLGRHPRFGFHFTPISCSG